MVLEDQPHCRNFILLEMTAKCRRESVEEKMPPGAREDAGRWVGVSMEGQKMVGWRLSITDWQCF